MAINTFATKLIYTDTFAAFFRPIYEKHVFREEFHYGLGILKLCLSLIVLDQQTTFRNQLTKAV